MIKLLYKTAADMGGELVIRAFGDDGFLMVVELPESAGFPIGAIAVRVENALKLDDGATWLLGQLAVGTIANMAEFMSDDDVSIQASSCEACGGGAIYTIEKHADAAAAGGPADEGAAATQLLLGAALELSIVAGQVRGGDMSLEEIQSEVLRISRALSDEVRDASELQAS